MSNDEPKNDSEEKTSVVASETLKIRLEEARKAPPAVILMFGPSRQVGKQWPLDKSEKIVGRSVEADVFIDDKSVSRKHARINVSNTNDVTLIDLGSANGTEVAGARVQPEVPVNLRHNDQIKLGNVILRFISEGNLESVSNQSVYDRALIDPLTQIYNKGALTATGEELFKKAQLTELPFTVILFDLDNFKKVNDTYGHPAGDFVLKEIAELIKDRLIRKEDHFSRFGGEEFCILLFGSDLKKGVEIAERIRQEVADHKFVYKDVVIPMTISMGVATQELTMANWDELFEQADQAAYVSKRNGKNRVSTL